MEDINFKINRVNGTIILEKDGQKLAISQSTDNDVWFSAFKEELNLEISIYSRNHSEWRTYMIFENLMKLIVGRYILSSDNENEYSMLPDDFVNLESKSIVWHSDNGTDNILKLEFNEKNIMISLLKSKKALPYENNVVRIRTSGSSYKNYYQEFLEFFRRLSELEYKLNESIETTISKQEDSSDSKKVFLFKRNK